MRKGFVIPEVLMVFVILVLVVGGALLIYTTSYNSWQESIAAVALYRGGNIVMEKMVRGARAPLETRRTGIREATSFSIPSSSVIRFTSGIDGQERSFYLTNNQIIYDPDTSIPDNEIVAAQDVQNLTFTAVTSRRVRVNATLNTYVKEKPISVDLQTEITIRN